MKAISFTFSVLVVISLTITGILGFINGEPDWYIVACCVSIALMLGAVLIGAFTKKP